ncbi:PPC domain-containing protein [Brevundimonas sp.]|uniref:PPC domain-containing protein n=1 Tax=Brevundimonas sp. TaxID=1871086 RepID=UPI0035AE2FF5
MRRQMILAAASWLTLSVAAMAAVAQEAQPLAIGDSVEGEITDEDARHPEGFYRYDAYAFEAREGQRLEAVMRSSAFDAALSLQDPAEADGEPLAFDDDGLGEGTDARLRFTADRTGTYILRAQTLGEAGAGPYTLALSERPAARPAPRPSGIRLGRTVQGELDARDPEGDDGLPYDAWSFRAGEGERFAIALDSEAFDPVVRVGRMEGGRFDELAMNDDGPDAGLNSRLAFTAPEGGTYVIRVTPLGAGSEGAYSLTLSEGPEPLPAQPIAIGDTVEGALTEDDGRNAAGVSADAWRFEGRAGQRIRIDMTSVDFDTYLELFDAAGNSLATDDDGGPEGANSRLIFTLPADGAYVIEARAFSSATGDYSLSLAEMEPERAPEPLAFGTTLEGEIGEGDSRDSEDRGYDGYVVTGRQGQRIQAIMRSGDFDTVLRIGRADGEFSALASDDDGLGEGTDSRLSYTLPEDGDYVLRASSYGPEGEGLYSLELIDRGPQPQPGSILVGATARGTLTESDATAADNSFYDAYRVTLKAEEKLTIIMASNEVDSFVVVGRPGEDEAFEVLGSDDDGLSDTHSKLDWTAPSDGTYEIRAGTFQQGQTGAYALIVEKQP